MHFGISSSPYSHKNDLQLRVMINQIQLAGLPKRTCSVLPWQKCTSPESIKFFIVHLKMHALVSLPANGHRAILNKAKKIKDK